MDNITLSQIFETNLRFFLPNYTKAVNSAAEQVSKHIRSEFKDVQTIAFVVGRGLKAEVALATTALLTNDYQVKIYLLGRSNQLSKTGQELFEKLSKQGINYMQDAYARDIAPHDLFVEALSGIEAVNENGQPKLFKRYSDALARLKKDKIVTLDVPAGKYKAELNISFNHPKVPDAKTVKLVGIDSVSGRIGPGEVQALSQPKQYSYKHKNGKLLIIGGSKVYQGAPILAANSAVNYAGIVYLHHRGGSMLGSLEAVNVGESELGELLPKVDALCIGPGLEVNYVNKALVNQLVREYKHMPILLDADAIGMVDPEDIRMHGKIVLTPHPGELRHLFADAGKIADVQLQGKLRDFAVKNHCVINLKGTISKIYSPTGELKINTAGEAGMGRAGTGDVLAGLAAAFMTKNDPYLSICAAAFVNGIAGTLARKEYGPEYSAQEIVGKQQEAIKLSLEA